MGKRWKTSGNRNIKLVMTEERYLKTVMKPNFKSGVLFGENLMGCEMGKIKVVMNKPVYLGQVILDLNKIVMYEFHYDYMKCGKNKKVIGLMKDELGDAIMTEFVALRPKLYSYRKVDGSKTSKAPEGPYFTEDKKCKGIKECVVKKTLTFEDYKTCLFNDSTEYRSQLMFRSTKHEVHTIEVNKVTLNRDDDKQIIKKDGISTFARSYQGQLSFI